MTQIYIYTTPLTVLLSMIYDTSVYMTDSIKSARFQLFIYGLCLALIAGFQLLLGSHKVFLWPELKLVGQFILLMS